MLSQRFHNDKNYDTFTTRNMIIEMWLNRLMTIMGTHGWKESVPENLQRNFGEGAPPLEIFSLYTLKLPL